MSARYRTNSQSSSVTGARVSLSSPGSISSHTSNTHDDDDDDGGSDDDGVEPFEEYSLQYETERMLLDEVEGIGRDRIRKRTRLDKEDSDVEKSCATAECSQRIREGTRQARCSSSNMDAELEECRRQIRNLTAINRELTDANQERIDARTEEKAEFSRLKKLLKARGMSVEYLRTRIEDEALEKEVIHKMGNKTTELLSLLLSSSSSSSLGENSNDSILDGAVTALDACIKAARSQQEEACRIKDDYNKEKRARERGEVRAAATEAELQGQIRMVSILNTHLSMAQKEGRELKSSFVVEEKGREDAERAISSLSDQLKKSTRENDNLKRAKACAEARASEMKANLLNAASSSSELEKTKRDLQSATTKVKQLEADLEYEREQRENDGATKKLEGTESDSDEDEEEYEPDQFGLTQMVSHLEERHETDNDDHHDCEGKRVGELMSKARKLLERSVNAHLEKSLNKSTAEINFQRYSLCDKINDLRDSARFPPSLISSMHSMRMMGNAAVHGRQTSSRAQAESVMKEFSRLDALFAAGRLPPLEPHRPFESIGRPDARSRQVRWA